MSELTDLAKQVRESSESILQFVAKPSKRVIKFRAWHTVKKEMFTAEQMGVDELSIHTNGRGFFNPHPVSQRLSEYYPDMISMQFTGLFDMYGVDIYEGDILSIIYDTLDEDGERKTELTPVIGYVAWNEHSTGWVIKCKSKHSVNDEGTVMTSIIHGPHGEREVIGNIYEGVNN